MVNRKPVDKLNGFDTREAIWRVIRELKIFTVRDLQQQTTMDVASVRDYCVGLERAGYLFELVNSTSQSDNLFVAKEYELVKDVGVDAPRVRKDGSKVVQGQGREQMWRAMRILKSFSALELAVNASTEECTVKESSAADYCKHLCHAGYLTKNAKGKIYRFLPSRYTGPKPPMIQRTKQVFDANLKKVMWSTQGGRHDK